MEARITTRVATARAMNRTPAAWLKILVEREVPQARHQLPVLLLPGTRKIKRSSAATIALV